MQTPGEAGGTPLAKVRCMPMAAWPCALQPAGACAAGQMGQWVRAHGRCPMQGGRRVPSHSLPTTSGWDFAAMVPC